MTFTPLPAYRDTPEQLSALLDSLETGATNMNKLEFSCKKHTNTVHGVDIDSWKINEWDYYLSKTLPIYARGLFTTGGLEEQPRIAVRGYNKFFNLGEKGAIQRNALDEHLKGPFYLSLKENGCIVFISALETGELLCCSKHSIGYRKDVSYKNHALEGEAQLLKQLKRCNIEPTELGKKLFELNITLVAELCDDEFEEHVLRYSKEDLGLYLHGLVFNTIEFKTYPMEQVEAFATEWGFKSVRYVTLDTVEQTLQLLDECAKTGTYNGREAEGFVIRCYRKEDLSDYFFKFKFKEPYLFYRQLREVAKKLWLSDTPIHKIMVNVKVHKALTLKYLEYLNGLDDPELKEQFKQNKGIIKIREMFFESISSSKKRLGHQILSSFDELEQEMSKLEITEHTKYALVPIATVGCGKTTVFHTLKALYPSVVGHIQNDNLGRKAKKQLVGICLQELALGKQVVCVDKNNQEKLHRVKLFNDIEQMKQDYLGTSTSLKVIALDFTSQLSREELSVLTMERVAKRGNNHQMLKYEENAEQVKGILNRFVKSLQPLDVSRKPDMLFDEVILLDPRAGSLDSVNRLVSRLAELIPELPKKTPREIEARYRELRQMKVGRDAVLEDEAKKEEMRAQSKKEKKKKKKEQQHQQQTESTDKQKSSKPKPKNVMFVGIKVPRGILLPLLEKALGANDQWKKLKSLNRVQQEFHITLCHRAMIKSEEVKPIWNDLLELDFEKVKASITLNKVVVHDDTLICVEVTINSFSQEVPVPQTITPHITVGTFASNIKPVELNSTLKLAQSACESITLVTLDNQPLTGLPLAKYSH
ncbi:uncharacterized protein KQ657_001841 [Scheffersomyces spartinae]|uniref:tRNA ligase n=1 Tax=Scheffersomyces spartinae TaxID=45513 RepID=A0A9P7V6U2_9ASCO|nr:uncharacterized protein KQ657_001841 [Scheffersomyces spartinae]KAG7192440.1 hypothetical protein KQ657_001841 [Scheffersomyces spartinae]